MGSTVPPSSLQERDLQEKSVFRGHLNACVERKLQGTEMKTTETGRADENLMDKSHF